MTSLGAPELKTLEERIQNEPELLNKINIAGKYYTALGKKSITAWDCSRYISLCGWGYVVGYLSEDEAWERVMPAARMLQQTFDSWEDLGNNYIIGRQFWSADYTAQQGDSFSEVLDTLSTSPGSPWRTIPWDLDLSPVAAGTKEKSEPATTRPEPAPE